jgi:hypothetical protein
LEDVMSDTDNVRTLPGGGVVNDRRTPEQREATVGFVVATDSFMSGWGQASRVSYVAVPLPNHGDMPHIVEANMRARSEMKRVRFVAADWRPRLRAGDHLSIVKMDLGGPFYRVDGFSRRAS